jgi:hypothetical protein
MLGAELYRLAWGIASLSKSTASIDDAFEEKVEAVTAANFQHFRVWFQHHSREDAALNPKAIVFRSKLPVLIEIMIEPFRSRGKAPLDSELCEMREGGHFSD